MACADLDFETLPLVSLSDQVQEEEEDDLVGGVGRRKRRMRNAGGSGLEAWKRGDFSENSQRQKRLSVPLACHVLQGSVLVRFRKDLEVEIRPPRDTETLILWPNTHLAAVDSL